VSLGYNCPNLTNLKLTTDKITEVAKELLRKLCLKLIELVISNSIHLFATSYNFLRIMSGSAGLQYRN
jgi:Leucine-rich repeat (LRR) protein